MSPPNHREHPQKLFIRRESRGGGKKPFKKENGGGEQGEKADNTENLTTGKGGKVAKTLKKGGGLQREREKEKNRMKITGGGEYGVFDRKPRG